MTTYDKHLYCVTGSTQAADAPLIRATRVLKTQVEDGTCIVKSIKRTPKKKKKEKKT